MRVLYRATEAVHGVARPGDYVWADFDNEIAPVIVRQPDGSLRPLGPWAVAVVMRNLRSLEVRWADDGILDRTVQTQLSCVLSQAARGERPPLSVAI